MLVAAAVTDEERLGRSGVERVERQLIDPRVRFANADLVRKNGNIDSCCEWRSIPTLHIVGRGVGDQSRADSRRAQSIERLEDERFDVDKTDVEAMPPRRHR